MTADQHQLSAQPEAGTTAGAPAQAEPVAATEQTAAATPATADVSAEATPGTAEEGDATARMRMQDLTAGQELTGTVKRIVAYGAFVNIGVGRDGLVHISELADSRVEKVEDVVAVGQTVTVRVIEVNPAKNRISLSMRSSERPVRTERRRRPEVNQQALTALSVGDSVEGVVKTITAMGAFVDIGVGKDGLVHISELSKTRVAKVEDAVTVGQGYTFKIIEIDAEKGRISLSLRRAQSEPAPIQLDEGQIIDGTVSGHSDFGVFVNIGVGRDGLVHNSEIPGDAKPEIGSAFKVRVLNVNAATNRISLSGYLDASERPATSERPDRPARADRPARSERADRPARSERTNDGGRRERKNDNRQPEIYTTTSYQDETFEGDASLDDLLARFGGAKRDRGASRASDDASNDLRSALPRDVIRRTLNISDDE
jgi:small subunit ribosomal protein S1